MAISVTHTFASTITDGGDATLVQPSNWNAAHTVTGAMVTITSTDNAVVRFNASLGQVQDSTAILDDTGFLSLNIDDAVTNAVTDVLRLTHTSTGTPAAGLGTGLEFATETAAGTTSIGAAIESVIVTATLSTFNLVFKNMTAGAAATEVWRMSPVNMYTIQSAAYATNLAPIVVSITSRYAQIIVKVSSSSWASTATPNIRVSTDGGSTYDATAANYPGTMFTGATAAVKVAPGLMDTASAITSGHPLNYSCVIECFQGGPFLRASTILVCTSASTATTSFAMYKASTDDVTHILLCSSLTTASTMDYAYAVYGVY
jgi:hypothetical protein